VTRAATLGMLALVLAVAVAPAVAASGDISVSTAAPSEVAVSETVAVEFEVTNDGAETTDALGLQVSSLPPGFAVADIESSGSVASERNAVFWTDPVEPGESVTAVVSVRVTDTAEPGDHAIRAVAATNETETQATVRLSVQSQRTQTQTATQTATQTTTEPTTTESPATTDSDGGDGDAEDEDDSGSPVVMLATVGGAAAVVAVLLKLR